MSDYLAITNIVQGISVMIVEGLPGILDFISILGSLLVGGVFLITGLAKVVDPHSFIRHIDQLRTFPEKAVVPAAFIFIALEYLLGNALIFRIFPQWLFPAMLIILVALSILTYWSTSTGRTEDCGCYTGLLIITPNQSLLLNSIYIALMSLAIFHPVSNLLSGNQQFWFLLLTVTSSILSTTISYQKLQDTGEALWELTPLKVNRRWQSQWLNDANDNLMQGNKIVVFLNPNCSHCQFWVKVLKVMHKHPAFPEVVGIMSASEETGQKFQAYIEEKSINFPVHLIEPSIFSLLVSATPTAVVLEEGVIKEKWNRGMPRETIEKLRTFRDGKQVVSR
ncbi:hypothetical protein GTQ43_25465 [Nostoc sp. KVJ3]|uniref:MauE/DoxX family redox-associated membrane protein n=1 Tax=Nostoc sp. KVJ3 TaxID=457945 RepID=UPI0022385618|nr:MauE/DoxX family redox-associated membrane protein [Nostoc sp. KVJ3]MCW5317045.1 hypothetical protein [Nostoc sp. KVJ3]